MLYTPAPCKVTVEFDDMTGISLPDGQCEEFINALVRDAHHEDVSLKVGTDMLICHIRLAVAQDRLDYRTTTFVFRGQVLSLTKHGNLVGVWPSEFCDWPRKIIQQLTTIRRK